MPLLLIGRFLLYGATALGVYNVLKDTGEGIEQGADDAAQSIGKGVQAALGIVAVGVGVGVVIYAVNKSKSA